MENIEETRNYFIKEIDQNELISKNHKKICKILNYIEHFLVLASLVSGCISKPVFDSSIDIYIGIMSSAIGLKIVQ